MLEDDILGRLRRQLERMRHVWAIRLRLRFSSSRWQWQWERVLWEECNGRQPVSTVEIACCKSLQLTERTFSAQCKIDAVASIAKYAPPLLSFFLVFGLFPLAAQHGKGSQDIVPGVVEGCVAESQSDGEDVDMWQREGQDEGCGERNG